MSVIMLSTGEETLGERPQAGSFGSIERTCVGRSEAVQYWGRITVGLDVLVPFSFQWAAVGKNGDPSHDHVDGYEAFDPR